MLGIKNVCEISNVLFMILNKMSLGSKWFWGSSILPTKSFLSNKPNYGKSDQTQIFLANHINPPERVIVRKLNFLISWKPIILNRSEICSFMRFNLIAAWISIVFKLRVTRTAPNAKFMYPVPICMRPV